MALSRPKPDGTEGTATAEIMYNKVLPGCIVKNDENLKYFLGEHVNDKEKLKNTKYFFYAYDPDFKEQSDMENRITFYEYSSNSRKSHESPYFTKVQEHIFLACSKDFEKSKFLRDNSKRILVAQDLNSKEVVYVLRYDKGKKSPKFFPLKLNVCQSSNVYGVDALEDHECYEKLENASPVLLKVKTGTGKDEEIVVGGLLKKESNEVSISIFGKNQDSSTPGKSEDVVQVEPHSQMDDEKSAATDGQPQPQNITYNYVLNFTGDQKIVTVGNQNTATLNKLIKEKVAEDAEENDQNPADDDVGDETVNTNVVDDQNSPADDVGDETDNPYVLEDQNPPAGDVGDETVNTNVVAKDQNDAAVAVHGPDRSLAVFQPVDACQEIISMIKGQDDIKKVECSAFAEALRTYLNVDRMSVETPPEKIMKKCQELCGFLKQERPDIFDKLKLTSLPNGMTGPRRDYRTVFQELPVKDRQDLTRAMTGNDELLQNLVRELLRKPSSQIGFYTRRAVENPAEKILAEYCQKRRLLVGDLYNILVRYGAPALADEYL